MARSACLALLPVLLVPAVSWAGDNPSLTAALLRTGWALAVVIALILALWALSKKRLLPGVHPRGSIIRVVEMRALGAKSTLALVEVRGREYLLGIGAGEIRLLAEVEGTGGDQTPADFAEVLAGQP